MIDDFSKERIKSQEEGFLIGLEIDETPCDAKTKPATDGLGLDLSTSTTADQHRVLSAKGASDIKAPPAEEPDDDWSLEEK